jgi:hypothetical protein
MGDLDKVKTAVIIGFFISLIGMTLPTDLFLDTISTWLIRGEMVFFGILAAGIIFQKGKIELSKVPNVIFNLLLVLQCSQVLAYSAFNVYFRYGNPLQIKPNFFESPTSGDKLFEFLQKSKNKYGNRMLLSPLIENDLNAESPVLAKENFYSISDINIHTGINVINDFNLKGISMDRIYSSDMYTKGWIKSNYDLFHNSSALDVSGINWVLIKNIEFQKHGPFPGLTAKDIFQFEWKDESWILLHNNDSWPKAFTMSDSVLNIHPSPSYREGCGHTGLLCAELEPFLQYKMNVKVKMTGSNGHYDLSIPSQSNNMVIGLSTMYRPEWEAYGDGIKLEITPLFNAFIGVEVPPGTTSITLDFNPKTRIRLTYISIITFAFCIIGLIIHSRNNQKLNI